jgi:hypothetical protein
MVGFCNFQAEVGPLVILQAVSRHGRQNFSLTTQSMLHHSSIGTVVSFDETLQLPLLVTLVPPQYHYHTPTQDYSLGSILT